MTPLVQQTARATQATQATRNQQSNNNSNNYRQETLKSETNNTNHNKNWYGKNYITFFRTEIDVASYFSLQDIFNTNIACGLDWN